MYKITKSVILFGHNKSLCATSELEWVSFPADIQGQERPSRPSRLTSMRTAHLSRHLIQSHPCCIECITYLVNNNRNDYSQIIRKSLLKKKKNHIRSHNFQVIGGNVSRDSPLEQTSSLELRARYSHNVHDGMCHKQ